MRMIRKVLGPQSKYDRSIPFTYEARIDVLHGMSDTPEQVSCFSDTVCGLVEYLEDNDVDPDDVELYQIFEEDEMLLKKKYVVSKAGKWMFRPQICKSLKDKFKGHIDETRCDYRDRDRMGEGLC